MAKQQVRIFGVNPFIKLQNNSYTMIKWDVWHLSAFVWAVFLCWFGVQCLKDCWHDNDISFFTCIFLRPKMMCRCHEVWISSLHVVFSLSPPQYSCDFCQLSLCLSQQGLWPSWKFHSFVLSPLKHKEEEKKRKKKKKSVHVCVLSIQPLIHQSYTSLLLTDITPYHCASAAHRHTLCATVISKHGA